MKYTFIVPNKTDSVVDIYANKAIEPLVKI